MEKIKCDICGYEFKTFQKLETHYEDYEPYEKMVSYPDPSDENPAHLVRNYICDKCYQNLGKIMQDNLIAQSEDFVYKLHERIEKERVKFNERVKKLEEDTKVVQSIGEKLKSIEFIYELSDEDIELIRKYSYAPFRPYYLNDAIRIEKSRMLKEKAVYDWFVQFSLKYTELPDGVMSRDMVNISKFKEIVKTSVLKNISFSDIQGVLMKIDDYIDESNS